MVELAQGHDVILRLAWILLNDRGEMLVVRDRKRDVYFEPGGRSVSGVKDEFVLSRKVRADLGVKLIPESIQLLTSFAAPAYGKPEEVMVQSRCYRASFVGIKLRPAPHIADVQFISSRDDRFKLSDTTEGIRQRLKEEGIMR